MVRTEKSDGGKPCVVPNARDRLRDRRSDRADLSVSIPGTSPSGKSFSDLCLEHPCRSAATRPLRLAAESIRWSSGFQAFCLSCAIVEMLAQGNVLANAAFERVKGVFPWIGRFRATGGPVRLVSCELIVKWCFILADLCTAPSHPLTSDLRPMIYRHVCLESVGFALPDEVVTSAEIEQRLAPLYERLRLPKGRLEMMTGIRERRFWPAGMLPSVKSVASGEQAICAAGIDRLKIGALIHGSVCRDFLEPATAAAVHHRLQLPRDCLVYDVSNACLGLLNGMIQVANMIELGQIRAGLVVGTESARPLVETTIERLNGDPAITRAGLKPAIASLTIGSGSAAALLVHGDDSRSQCRLAGAVAYADTEHHALCHSGRDESIAGDMRPQMETDSERLLEMGVRAGVAAFSTFQKEIGWSPAEIDKTFSHQVTTTHRKLMLSELGLEPKIDFPTVETLGNTGSVALPLALAMGIEAAHLRANDRAALLGIGSGINVLLAAVECGASVPFVGQEKDEPALSASAAHYRSS